MIKEFKDNLIQIDKLKAQLQDLHFRNEDVIYELAELAKKDFHQVISDLLSEVDKKYTVKIFKQILNYLDLDSFITYETTESYASNLITMSSIIKRFDTINKAKLNEYFIEFIETKNRKVFQEQINILINNG